MTKLTELDPFWTELRSYSDHFLPLLEFERVEAERQFNERLKDWSNEQLFREGFMLEGLGASTTWQPKFKLPGTVATFSRLGSDATKPLPVNQFEPGTTVLLSRTDPLVDPALDEENETLKGYVFSTPRGSIRIVFPSVPKDIDSGRWRIDVGYNDFAFRRQIEAINRLNLDPFAQDALEFVGRKPDEPVLRCVEDEALHATRKRAKTEQRVLMGTGLRDLLLRRFQDDVAPATNPAPGDRSSVSDAVHMKPTDIDATVSPTTYEEGAPSILAQNQLIQSWTRRYLTREGQEPVAVEGDPHIPLNPSQIRAIALMLSERLSLVQGPPGTGKTRVIVETIKLLKQHWQIPHPILVTAHTNVAVDNLLDGMRAHGLKGVRFGNASRVPETLQDLTFDAKLESHPLARELEDLKLRKQRLQDEIERPQTSASGRQSRKNLVNRLNGQMYMLRKRLSHEILADADVICTTCLSATSRMLDLIDFPFVFLDEASMASEPLSLVPLTKGSAQVAIIGDHKQLPPVIVSEDAQMGGLALSLFERLIHEHHVPSIMLDTQYRMHPAISAFSSKTFYNSELKDGTVLSDGSVRAGLDPPQTAFLLSDDDGKPRNVTFLNHDYPESPLSRSIANYHEAGRVCDIVADILHRNPDLKGSDIGVIAPYIAQIRTITDFLKVNPERQAAFSSWLGEDRANEVGDIEVKTVDGFEGREKAVIIFSTVRSNPAGYIGFLADWRRLNVGLTRAKRALIILGSERTLASARTGTFASESLPQDGAKVWRRFVKHLKEGKLIMHDPA